MINWLRKLFGCHSTPVAASATDTEFTAEVVRVTAVRPHPNADRLEIANIELKGSGPAAYEVVIGKGNFVAGDLAAYFSVDCVLPTNHPEFKFLTERLDGKGKDYYRLRAARLRGVFSQGLLVPVRGCEFGAPVAELVGVTYHRDPEPEERGPTSRSSAPRAQPMPIYGVESLKKVPHLFAPGEPVHVTEKIHGTNMRFGWVPRTAFGIRLGWRFVVGSHRVIKDGGGPGYYGEDLWTRAADRMDLRARTRDYKGFVFYGELYGYSESGKKIQDLTYDSTPASGPKLAIFDVRLPNGEWCNPYARRIVLADTGLDSVPVLSDCVLWNDRVRDLAEGKSALDGRTQREGVVVESAYGPRKKAKFVGQGYLLRKEAA